MVVKIVVAVLINQIFMERHAASVYRRDHQFPQVSFQMRVVTVYQRISAVRGWDFTNKRGFEVGY